MHAAFAADRSEGAHHLAVRLRLKRTGRKNRAHFRIVAIDSRVKRDGKTLEDLGSYDPAAATNEEKAQIKVDRVHHIWEERVGVATLYHFSVSDGSDTFHLVMNNETLSWHMEGVSLP